jgi:3-oxoacyl-[acyl-carrier-protein] synthase-1
MNIKNKNKNKNIDIDIYIENMSACCSAGLDHETIFDATLLGNSGVKKHQGFLSDGGLSAIGKIESSKSFNTLMIESITKILNASDLDDFSNTFLAIGTSVGGMAWAENQFIEDKGSYTNMALKKQSLYSISHTLNQTFNFKDSITFSTACTSSSNAIIFAKELIEAGAYDNVLVVGADSISYTTVNGFNALGVLSSEISTPFDANRTGMNVAEGIGAILLSTTPSKIKLVGVGCSSDAHNITNPHPQGEGAKIAMKNALENAQINSTQIDYINAHGTGTVANDSAEGNAIKELFSHHPPVGSTKSITGHTLGACGAIELIISALSLEKQTLPANFNLQTKEIEELTLPTENIKTPLRFVLSNAFAFGGNNVSLILQKVETA